MVNIITGAAQSDREDIFVGMIKSAAEKGKKVLVIVPDQFSFEYDKMLYNAMGAKLFNSIETTGFNRLAELICEQYGSARDTADDNAKLILMFKAVKRVSKEGGVKYYKNSLDKASFLSELISFTERLRESGIAPDDLRVAAERLEGSVSLKLFDICRIYSYYLEELDNAGIRDSLSAMAEAVRLAKDNDHFGLTSVFVSAFTSFSYDERKMLELCVSQGDELAVSLLLDENAAVRHGNGAFALTVKTKRQITDMARSHSKKVTVSNSKKSSCNSADIKRLGEKLFDFQREKYVTDDEDVQIFCADDVYEEADFICAEICRLVREKGYCFNDIAITVRELKGFAPVIEGALEKYGIPYFIDKRDSVDASAIVHYINAVFRAVLTKSFKTDNILKLIKSPLYGLLNYEICDLEDYCVRWSVEGDMWLAPFTAEPRDGVSLERINKLREQVITPLLEFKNACADATAGEISRAFYKLLSDIRLSEQTYSLVKRASADDNETNSELARGLKQLWNMSLSAIKSIYEILGDEKLTLRRYYELYGIMLSQMKISNPPQKLDCVRVTDAARSRLGRVRAVFAAEVNDGVFPAQAKNHDLVTEHEKELLRVSENIDIESNVRNDNQAERLAAYTTFCSPSERLYVSYSLSDLLGSEKRPSMLVKEVREILGIKDKRINELPLDFFCTSYKTAYVKYIEHSRDKNEMTESIFESLMGSETYFDKLMQLKRSDSGAAFRLSQKAAQSTFFKTETVKTSPTKLDNYFKCPFMYFCSYGLKLDREQKMDIDGLNKGLLVHSVLEKAISVDSADPYENRKKFLEMDDSTIDGLINSCFDEYYDKVFCGDFGKTHTFDYRFARLREQMHYIVKYVQQELENSRFSPVMTEYEVTHVEGQDQLDLKLEDGRKIVLIGTIDRADIYENEDGEKFVRIIDYKYRKKTEFSLAELYCGLDLQMLVYLSLLLETDNPIDPYHELKQAGVFYLKLYGEREKLGEDCELTEEELYSAACSSAIEMFSRKGRITSRSEVNKALDKNIHPTTLSRITMNDTMFTAMRIFAKRKVVEYGNRLLKGDIDARPMEGACGYCMYGGICGRAFPDDPVKGTKEQLEAELESIADEFKKEEEQ